MLHPTFTNDIQEKVVVENGVTRFLPHTSAPYNKLGVGERNVALLFYEKLEREFFFTTLGFTKVQSGIYRGVACTNTWTPTENTRTKENLHLTLP